MLLWRPLDFLGIFLHGLTLLFYLLEFKRLARDYDYQRSTFTISPRLFSELYTFVAPVTASKAPSLPTYVSSAAEISEGDR